jgi:hypothetical protein
MAQHQHPVIDGELPADPADSLHIETPIIDIQDLEHKDGPRTRVSNKGVKIEPSMDSTDEINLGNTDEDMLDALEELEKSMRGQLPG